MVISVAKVTVVASELSGNFLKGLNFQIQEGSTAAFVFKNRDEGEEFFQLLLGMKRPDTGSLKVFENNPAELSRDELIEIRRRIGVVFKEGGLISNLRAWENMVLPSLYHRRLSSHEIKEKGLRLLDELGFRKASMTRIAELTAFEKTLLGLGRAILLEPDIIILYSALEGLNLSDKEQVINCIQRLKRDRTALLYILHSHEDVGLIKSGFPNLKIFDGT